MLLLDVQNVNSDGSTIDGQVAIFGLYFVRLLAAAHTQASESRIVHNVGVKNHGDIERTGGPTRSPVLRCCSILPGILSL